MHHVSLRVGPLEAFFQLEQGADLCRVRDRRKGEIVIDLPYLSVALSDHRKFGRQSPLQVSD